MSWLIDLFSGESIAHTLLVLSLIIAGGLALGALKYRQIELGVAGVLFMGIAFGHFGVRADERVMEFLREFGLILFVYTIGMQVGPGFFDSLKRQGAPLNALATAIVVLGAALAFLFHRFGGVDIAAAVGLFSGATTNTPSLGAAQQALQSVPELAGLSGRPGMAYAVAYPFGILGIILASLALRALLRIRVSDEEARREAEEALLHPAVARLNLRVTNKNLAGMRIDDIPGIRDSGVVISRVRLGDHTEVAHDETILQVDQILLAVGSAEELERLRIVVGERSDVDLHSGGGELSLRRIVVTRSAVLGHSLDELKLEQRCNVRFTRLSRAEVDLPDPQAFRLHAGDRLTVVGAARDIDVVSRELGNSFKELDRPHLVPLFIGVALGIVLGSIPLAIPGIPAAVRLGLAGGPLIVALLLSAVGRIGPLFWYIPSGANQLMREIGIVLFLACVGLHSGEKFIETVSSLEGLRWLLFGACITFLPLAIVGLVGRLYMKLNYLSILGLLAGSMTDPPALAFANSQTKTSAPALAYAAVYPLTMLLRVVCAQLLVLVLA
ncbi:MAG: putative transporter [Leptospirales bacterium]|nr:putative transporter [Leptospirales bacterium]